MQNLGVEMKSGSKGLSTVQSLKKEFLTLIKSKNIDEVKTLLSKAQKEIATAVGKDSKELKSKIKNQKNQIERMLAKVLTSEIKRAEKFLNQKKKELAKLEGKAAPKKAAPKRKAKEVKVE